MKVQKIVMSAALCAWCLAAVSSFAIFCPYDDKDQGHSHDCGNNGSGNGAFLNCATTNITCKATLTMWGPADGNSCAVYGGTTTVTCSPSTATALSSTQVCPN